jgi:hypothetical protein
VDHLAGAGALTHGDLEARYLRGLLLPSELEDSPLPRWADARAAHVVRAHLGPETPRAVHRGIRAVHPGRLKRSERAR